MTMRIPITEATATQLSDFATNILNLDPATVGFRRGAEAIRAQMALAGYTDTHIEVGEGAPVMAQPATGAAPARKMVRIHIAADDKVGGQRPVPVSVNGKAMLIPRGKDVDVPFEYFKALDDAKMKIKDPAPNGGLSEAREVKSYPFSVVAA